MCKRTLIYIVCDFIWITLIYLDWKFFNLITITVSLIFCTIYLVTRLLINKDPNENRFIERIFFFGFILFYLIFSKGVPYFLGFWEHVKFN